MRSRLNEANFAPRLPAAGVALRWLTGEAAASRRVSGAPFQQRQMRGIRASDVGMNERCNDIEHRGRRCPPYKSSRGLSFQQVDRTRAIAWEHGM
jgi:hypothetical protein